jgi:hypothetical protein
MFEAANTIFLKKVRPGDIQQVIKSLKMEKMRGIESIPNECLMHLPRRSLVHIKFILIIESGQLIFPKSPNDNNSNLTETLRGPEIFLSVHVKNHLFTTGIY